MAKTLCWPWLTSACAGALLVAPAPFSRAGEVITSPVTHTQVLLGDTRLVITETGSVATTAVLDNAVESLGDRNVITNLGHIATSGVSSFGIFTVGNHGTILNMGTVRTTEDLGFGITNFGTNTRIINTGTVVTAGANTSGIANFGSDTTISNSGAVRNSGTGSAAIFSQGTSSKIVNTGQIISERASAIQIEGVSTGTSVSLKAPGYLGGAITFNSPASLDITTGASHSVFWKLPTNLAGGRANPAGPVPWFYNPATGQFATFDPTGPTARFNQFADTADTLARLGRNGLEMADTGGTGEGAPGALPASDPRSETSYGLRFGRFWISGFGGTAHYSGDDTTLDQAISQVGAAAGFAWQHAPATRLGLMAGYLNGTIAAQSQWADAQDIKSHGVFAGVFGDHRFGAVTFGTGVAGGWQENDSSRFINDNTATTGGLTVGESSAAASYDSWFLTSEATLSADFDLGTTGLTVIPGLRGRLGLQHTGVYSETGSDANARVGAHTLGLIEADLEVAVSRHIGPATLTGRFGYLFRSSFGNDDVRVTLLGISNSVEVVPSGRSAVSLGGTIDVDLGSQARFTVDGRGSFSNDAEVLQGTARFAIRF
ncbi:autotransporter domain-containing protein [Roseibium sp.]|uniref:autotransporter outer membrane beta-barrel domain-containing protein n=1 Tax=Roseibium sp. TaxID=1936156 RepID=UPI003BAC9F24